MNTGTPRLCRLPLPEHDHCARPDGHGGDCAPELVCDDCNGFGQFTGGAPCEPCRGTGRRACQLEFACKGAPATRLDSDGNPCCDTCLARVEIEDELCDEAEADALADTERPPSAPDTEPCLDAPRKEVA